MRFRKNNAIKYMQDFSGHRGLPSGVDFKVYQLGLIEFVLIGKGHGDPADYGNGPIRPYGLTHTQRKRFLENATGTTYSGHGM